MTQVFANISSLADFLIAQKNISKTQTDENSPVSGFEDFLSGQMTIEDLSAKSQKASDFGTDKNLIDFEELANSNMPIWDLSNFSKLPMQQLTAPNEQAIEQPVIDTSLLPSESFMPVQMNLGQLKQMASLQSIPISVTLNPAELASITNANGLKGAAIAIPDMPDIKVSQNQEIQSGQVLAELPQMTQFQSDMARDISTAEIPAMEIKPQPAETEKNIQLTFDAAKLIDAQNPILTASVSQDKSVPREMQVKVIDLLKLIEEMPEKPVVQIKSIPVKENQNQNLDQSGNSSSIPKFEKSYLVNLNALVSKDDSESVEAIQKTTLTKTNPIKTAPMHTATQSASLDSISESARVSANPVTELAEISMPATENVKPGRQINRKLDDQKITKTESIEPRPANVKLANQEIQPVQANKSAENSLANIFGRGQDFNQTGIQIAAEEKPVLGNESPNFLIGQQRILNQIQSQLQSFSGNTQLTIQLKPESLGKVKVELKTDGDKLNAIFRVDSADVKRVLDAELPNLKNDWKIDNFRVETNARGANDSPNNSGNFNQARMSDGRSSGASIRTNQTENGRDIHNQNATNMISATGSGRIDFFA